MNAECLSRPCGVFVAVAAPAVTIPDRLEIELVFSAGIIPEAASLRQGTPKRFRCAGYGDDAVHMKTTGSGCLKNERERRNMAELTTQGPIEPLLEVSQRTVRAHTRCFLDLATEIERECVRAEFAHCADCSSHPRQVTGVSPGGQRASVALVYSETFGEWWFVGWRRRGGRGGYKKGEGCWH